MKKIGFHKIFDEKGNAMVFVIIIFFAIMILSGSMAFLFNNNLKQTKYQQDSLEAYYLAYSGGMIAYEALLANNSAKLNEIIDNNSTLSVSSKPMGRGTVSVVAEISTDEKFEGWIKITSTAVLDRNNLTNVRNLYFDPTNPLEMLWSSN